jgi:hypothetical protein
VSNERFDVGCLGDVRSEEGGLAAGLLDIVDGRGAAIGVAISEDDFRTAACESQRRRTANARASARDKRNFTVELTHRFDSRRDLLTCQPLLHRAMTALAEQSSCC